jgi:protease-4
MFTNILNKIDFFRKILINTFFLIFLLGIFLFLLITPFLGESINKKESILFLDASSQESINSSLLSKNSGLNNFEIVNVIEIAEKDDEIETILIDISLMNLSATDANEIGESLNSFRSSGKKVITYGDFYFQNQYLLASYSDEIILNPFGLVYLEGYKNYRFYLKEALNKLNININTFVAGDYKSASEIFTNESMSENSKSESMRFLSALWNEWIKNVSSNREKEISIKIQDYIDNIGTLIDSSNKKGSNLALDLGLVDKIMNRKDMENYLSNLNNNRDYFLTFSKYHEISNKNESKNKLAIIDAKGEIVDGDVFDNNLSSGHFSRLIKKVKKGNYQGLLIRLNTPGGSGFASEIIRQEIIQLKDLKIPIIVSMADIAASGGYWISADVDEIWASPFTLTGSIGVWTALPDFDESLEDFGINYDGVSTTKFNPSLITGPDDNSKLLIQSVVNSAYEYFLEVVSNGRNLDKDFTKTISEGKIWTSIEAKENGLIDEIGSQRNSLDRLAQLAKLNDYNVDLIEEEISFLDQISLFTSDFFPITINNLIDENLTGPIRSIFHNKQKIPFDINLLCLECFKDQ